MNSELMTSTENMTRLIDNANCDFEKIWRNIVEISNEVGSKEMNSYALRRLISYNPTNPLIQSQGSQFQGGINIICDMITRTIQVIKNSPNDSNSWSVLGKCYLLFNDFPNAYSSFAHVLRTNIQNNDPYFWYSIGCTYQRFNYNEDAINFFSNALKIDPGFLLKNDIFLRFGFAYRSTQDYTQALNYFENALRNPPSKLSEDDIRFQMAFTHQLAGNYAQANKEYLILYKKYPNSLKILQQLAWSLSLLEKNQRDMAEQHILTSVFTSDPLLKFVLARISMRNDDMENAYQRYCDCISDFSESPVFWCGLGLLYFRNHQYQDSLVAFQRALYLKPEIPEAWLNLGAIYEQQGDIGAASRIYQAGTGSCPGNQALVDAFQRSTLQNGKNQRVPKDLDEIKDSKYITQVAEKHSMNIMKCPPPIPGFTLSDDPNVQKQIETLHMNYPSISSDLE